MSDTTTLSNKNILVIGGAGFIGTNLVRELCKINSKVIVLDNFSVGSKESLKGFDVEIIEGDITVVNDFKKINSDVDYIVNLAAYSNFWKCEKDSSTAFKINVQGTFNVFKFGLERNVKKVLFPSSCLIYGKHPKYLPQDEKHPIEFADSVYTTTKKIGEDMAAMFHEKFKLPVTWFRFFNNYGPGQQADYFIPTLIIQAMKNKEIELWSTKPIRDYIYVGDTVNALIKGLISDFSGGPINIGSGIETSTGDVAKQVAEMFDAKLRVLDKEVGGPLRQRCDYSFAKTVLGWEPIVKFGDGLKETIEWWKRQINLSTS